MGDRDGGLRQLGRDVKQLHAPAGRGQDRRRRRARPRLPAASGSVDGRHRPPAREGRRRGSARVRDPRGLILNYNRVPGLVEVREEHGETTLLVDTPRLREAARHLRDELGFDFLSDVTATDSLGWEAKEGSGYIGTPTGRDRTKPSTQGLPR